MDAFGVITGPVITLRWILLAVALSGSTACSTLNYYGQSIGGHLSLMAKRQPIDVLLGSEHTSGELKQRLQWVRDARLYGIQTLHLPDNNSYTTYVQLANPYVVWTVVAAPEFSLQPMQWCFPFVGCVSYRGYFAQAHAEHYAQRLSQQGMDVMVAGAGAYSTLGWFADPVLSSMVEQPRHHVAGVIFHELAHQQVYIADDSAFNEAFATAVEVAGVRRWLEASADEVGLAAFEASRQNEKAFVDLVLRTRTKLSALYDSELPQAEMRIGKRRLLQALKDEYNANKAVIGVGSQPWFDQNLNNASLALVATYHDYVESFLRLLASVDGDMSAFYAAVETLGRQPRASRQGVLNDLSGIQ